MFSEKQIIFLFKISYSFNFFLQLLTLIFLIVGKAYIFIAGSFEIILHNLKPYFRFEYNNIT